jgi:uncharacterized DUF497 family protein
LYLKWDDAKAGSNWRKHGIRFEDAVEVFDDDYRLTEQDRDVHGEARWQTLGMDDRLVVLLIAHLSFDEDELEVVRIISARLADRKERTRYGKNRKENFS